jgi:protein TonB
MSLSDFEYKVPGTSRRFAVFSILTAITVSTCTVWFLPLLDCLFPEAELKPKFTKVKTVEIKEQKPPERIYQDSVSKTKEKPNKPKLLKTDKPVKPQVDIKATLSLEALQMNSDNSLTFSVTESGNNEFEGEGLGKLVFDLNQVDKKPVAISTPKPFYPYRAKRRKIEGKVVLHIVISAQGEVSDLKLISAEPTGYFEDAALKAVKKWKFKPGQVDGENVAVKREQTIKFSLEK